VKAYILKHNHPKSNAYAKICAESCNAVKLDWEYFEGWTNCTGRMAWCETGIKTQFNEPMEYMKNTSPVHRANACSAGHAAIWKKIAEGEDEVGIVLEHDAIMYYKPDIRVPDNYIIALGYKMADISRYDYIEGNKQKRELINISGHEGAHSYMMTKRTAQNLIHEIETKGVLGAVDNAYFIQGQRKTSIPLLIMSPTPAIGYLRDSTIWSDGASYANYKFIESFAKYYK